MLKLILYLSTIKCDLLLGRNFLSHPRVILNVDSDNFEIDYKRPDIISFNEIISIEVEKDLDKEIKVDIEESLPDQDKTKVKNIVTNFYLNKNFHILESNTDTIPELVIELKDVSVFYFNPRRLSYFEKNKLQIILDDLLDSKIIKPSNTEYSSPIVLVKKKNGEIRLCIDYRELNKRMIKDRYSLPLIDDHLDSLRRKHYYM